VGFLFYAHSVGGDCHRTIIKSHHQSKQKNIHFILNTNIFMFCGVFILCTFRRGRLPSHHYKITSSIKTKKHPFHFKYKYFYVLWGFYFMGVLIGAMAIAPYKYKPLLSLS